MTPEESKQIDAVLVWSVLAKNKGVDSTDVLNAFAFDIHMIRHRMIPTRGEKWATEKLID